MTIVEQLRDIVRRAMMTDKQLSEAGLERPVFTAGSDELRAISIASDQLSNALAGVATTRRTLEWYANPANYERLEFPTNVGQDGGQMARVALARMLE